MSQKYAICVRRTTLFFVKRHWLYFETLIPCKLCIAQFESLKLGSYQGSE